MICQHVHEPLADHSGRAKNAGGNFSSKRLAERSCIHLFANFPAARLERRADPRAAKFGLKLFLTQNDHFRSAASGQNIRMQNLGACRGERMRIFVG